MAIKGMEAKTWASVKARGHTWSPTSTWSVAFSKMLIKACVPHALLITCLAKYTCGAWQLRSTGFSPTRAVVSSYGKQRDGVSTTDDKMNVFYFKAFVENTLNSAG